MLNCVNLMGRMVADASLHTTQTGKLVASFRVACDRSRKDDGADFIDVVAWSKTAEIVSKYFPKGSLIGITGRIQTRAYTDRNGNKRTAFEIVASEVHFCGGKDTTHSAGNGSEQNPAPDGISYMPVSEKASADVSADDEFRVIDDTDDLPF